MNSNPCLTCVSADLLDEIHTRYLGKIRHTDFHAAGLRDPQTKEAPKVNARQIDELVRRGAHVAVCQMATRAYAGVITTAVGSTQDAIYSELAANLVPNAHPCQLDVAALRNAGIRS